MVKQPDSHRGTNHKEGNVVVGGNYMTSRRIANIHLSEFHRGFELTRQDCPVTTFVLQDPNKRWIFLMPLPLSVQRSKQCSHLGSTMHDTDAAVIPPVHLVWVSPQQNQMIHPNEGLGSPKSSSHSLEKPLRKSNLRNKRSRSLKSTSNEWLPSCHLPNNSSDLVCENSSLIVSEALGDGFPKVDKTAKRSSRKKGKKKGKRCKRSLHKKDVDTEMLPGRSLHQNTTFEKPLYSDPSCLGEGISESNSSHSAISSGLSMQLLKEKSDEDNRSNHVNHLTAAISETPCSDNMDESEPTVSFSDEFVGENISLHKAGLTTDSCSKNSILGSTILPSFFQEDTNASSNELSSYPCCQIKTIEKEKYSSSSICGPSHIDDGVVEKPSGHIQSCSSSSQSCISYRKERHDRRRPGSSSNAHRFPNMNARGGTGKETVNFFWQRVQKKDAEECSYGQEISVSSSQQEDVLEDNCETVKKNSFASKQIRNHKSCRYPCSDETSAQSNSNTICSTVTDSNDFQCKPSGGKSLTVLSEKFKTKSALISNQEVTHYDNRKAFHRGRTNDSKFLKGFPQHDELLNKSKTTHYEEVHDYTLLSSCSNDIQDNTGSHPSELQEEEGKQITQEGRPDYGHSCFHACDGSTQTAQTLFCPLSRTSNCERNCLLEMLSTGGDSILHKEGHHYVSHVDDGDVVIDVKLDTGEICAEHGKQVHYPGCTIQKWIPVEKKPVAVVKTEHENESVSDKENALEIESDNQHIDTLLDQTGPLLPHSNSRQEAASCSTSKTIGQESSLRNSVSKTNSRHDSASSSLKMEECMLKLDTDLDKIVKAVNDAYSSQTISENYYSYTGIPLAEFERVLQSASPVIGDIHNLLSCKSCSQYQLIADFLCEHQMPGISLGKLWSWFEKPGTYGLEVKVEDHNLKSIGNARSEFRAYFVPYLSAVQIFSRTKCSTVSETCSSDGKCRDTSIPLTQKEESMLSPNGTDSSATDENCHQSVHGNELDETELLFEYFESDPPQQRLPLFEKMKELVRGDVSSTCKISGDPSTLQYLHLNDIHPASWYSVSWYPIYRIPDGNFRAAFLTYHSLGYFIKRNFESAPNGRMQIVSPVVGLQSYNSKGECWFQQSKCTKEQASSLNPSEILKERLRILDQTASVMARASFRRGGSKVFNRQPDYEFFLSRKW